MSEHWSLDADIARWVRAEEIAPARKAAWPDGATTGLVLVAACCLAVGLTLYQLAGPRDVVEEGVAPLGTS